MIIDAENPGKLKISEKSYDRCVAGIISGAGGINPGMIMGQSGTIAANRDHFSTGCIRDIRRFDEPTGQCDH